MNVLNSNLGISDFRCFVCLAQDDLEGSLIDNVSFDDSKRHEGTIKDLEKKQEGHREAMAKLQSAFQQQQVKAAAKA